jgi:hypothetical protein
MLNKLSWKIWFTKLCLYYLDTQKTHFLQRTNIGSANETVTPRFADCWDTPVVVKLLEHLMQANLLNCGLLMTLDNLVKQECAAAAARWRNLEFKPRYSYRLTNDILGTGPSLTFSSLLVTWWTNRFNIQQLYILPTLYVICIYFGTNSDLCHLHHILIDCYNREEKCLLHGTNWVSKIKPSALCL